MNRKTITGAAAAVIIAATVAIVTMDPRPADLVSREPEPSVFVPLTVWACCSVNGCREVNSPPDCPASDDLVSCCAPSTEPDGSVSCGC